MLSSQVDYSSNALLNGNLYLYYSTEHVIRLYFEIFYYRFIPKKQTTKLLKKVLNLFRVKKIQISYFPLRHFSVEKLRKSLSNRSRVEF